MGRYGTAAWVGVLGALVLALLAVSSPAFIQAIAQEEYNRTTVEAVDANGTHLESVDVRISDTYDKRYLGLSNTTSLDENEGMLFVYGQEGTHSYVMRDMDFPLDIIFVGANGTVNTIHHAPVPPEGTSEGDLERYSGTGQYVLEVNRGWSNETGFDEGDHLCVPDSL